MDKYSICMVIHEFYSVMAGAELFVYEVSKRLVQKGHTIHVITRRHKNLPRYEKIEGIHVHRVPFLEIPYLRSVTFYLPAYLKVLQLFKKNSINIVHGHIPRSGGFIASLIKKTIKRTVTIPRLRFIPTIRILPWFILYWLFYSAGFYFLVKSLSIDEVPMATALAFPFAGTLGVMAIIAPGGLGVREGFK